MRADGQKFQHRRLVQRDTLGLVHKGLGQRQVFAQRAVAVHAQHLDGDAAIGLARAARHAASARQIGHHIHRITHGQPRAAMGLRNLPRKLVAHDAGVLQEGLGTAKNMQVGSAHADPAYPHQHLAGRAHG